MTILVDFNQVLISNIMMQVRENSGSIELDENLIRHMALTSIKRYKNKFSKDYGEMVICCDDQNYWRKDKFPYYKARRKDDQKKSDIDWTELFRIINLIRSEIEEYFPYKVIQIASAEADDIIGSICHTYGQYLNNDSTDKILILSADKDFIQLHVYANVVHYDPIRDRWINHDNPQQYLFEHILKGDRGDGIPNVLSDGDSFVMSKRQKTMTQKRLDALMGFFKTFIIPEDFDPQVLNNIKRNTDLIDLERIPYGIKELVIAKYEEENKKDKSKLFDYFIARRLRNLMDTISEF